MYLKDLGYKTRNAEENGLKERLRKRNKLKREEVTKGVQYWSPEEYMWK